jgi:hypothetical protein
MSGKSIDVSHLAQAWIHSHEEDTATTSVYRPATFPFRPSRGRTGFHLRADGTLTTRQPGPTDQTETTTGKWELDGDQLELSAHGTALRVLCIESVEPDRLVVRTTPACPRK